MFWGVEKGQILSSVGPLLDRRMQETRTFIATKPFTSKADKPTRAQAIRGWAALNGLYCPMKAPWWSAMQTELLQFPVSRTDDCVDALSLVGRMFDVMQPQPKAVEGKKDWRPLRHGRCILRLVSRPGAIGPVLVRRRHDRPRGRLHEHRDALVPRGDHVFQRGPGGIPVPVLAGDADPGFTRCAASLGRYSFGST